MKSTLIELPPESAGLIEDSIEFVDADSVDELAERSHIEDQKVLARLLLPGQSFGPYKILGFLAAGGMGEVYAAERIMKDGRRLGPVALKVIAPEYMDDWAIAERFKREAQISRAIRSPHVTRVYEFGETPEGHAFLAMELLQGEELFERMYTSMDFTVDEAASTMLELLAGLSAVHKAGFVHRDIKPENVYFCRRDVGDEIVKILDFGIAKRSDQASDPFLSVVGKVYGTPEYIAPEQGLNPDVDHRADLYSAGVIMYELLAKELPFDGDTSYAIILKHQNDDPPPLPVDIPIPLQRIVKKALAKKADARFQTAEDFASSIRRWVNGEEEALDTGNLELLREPRHTPLRGVETPHTGLKRPGFSEPDGLSLSETPAPPVQIFSKSKSISTEMKRPKELIKEHTKPRTPARTPAPEVVEAPARVEKEVALAPGEPAGVEPIVPVPVDEESTKMATMVTAIVIAVIVAAALWAAFA